MFGPWLTPENTQFGPSGISVPSASSTQSVGVPSTWNAPSERRCARRGRWSVSECDVPLCSRSGATTVTCPTVAHTSASSEIPGASTPSSLETRILKPSCLSVTKPQLLRERADHAPGVAEVAKMARGAVDRRHLDRRHTITSPQSLEQEIGLELVTVPGRLDPLRQGPCECPESGLGVPDRLAANPRRDAGRQP